MQCDLCGKEGELVIAVIEGTRMTACSSCAKFGEIKGRVAAPEPRKAKHSAAAAPQAHVFASSLPAEETIEVVREDYAQVIRHARERKGLKQDEFAKLLRERESVIHAMEAGKHAPNIPLARKLEKILGIQLVRTLQDTPTAAQHRGSAVRTIGDLIGKR